MGTTHFDDEFGLLYVATEVYVGQSPDGLVILISRAPIMKGGLVAKCIDETPVFVEDVVRMTKAVIADSHEPLDEELVDPTIDELSDPIVDELVDQTTGECSR